VCQKTANSMQVVKKRHRQKNYARASPICCGVFLAERPPALPVLPKRPTFGQALATRHSGRSQFVALQS
jgi:hypothetical protein